MDSRNRATRVRVRSAAVAADLTRGFSPRRVVFDPDAANSVRARSSIALEFHPIHSDIMVSTHGDYTAKISSFSRALTVNTLRGYRRTPWLAGFSPNGNFLVTADISGLVMVHEFPSGNLLGTRTVTESVPLALSVWENFYYLGVGSYVLKCPFDSSSESIERSSSSSSSAAAAGLIVGIKRVRESGVCVAFKYKNSFSQHIMYASVRGGSWSRMTHFPRRRLFTADSFSIYSDSLVSVALISDSTYGLTLEKLPGGGEREHCGGHAPYLLNKGLHDGFTTLATSAFGYAFLGYGVNGRAEISSSLLPTDCRKLDASTGKCYRGDRGVIVGALFKIREYHFELETVVLGMRSLTDPGELDVNTAAFHPSDPGRIAITTRAGELLTWTVAAV